MKNYFNRVPEITKLLLLGNDSYEEFIKVLHRLNAPNDYSAFYIFFVKELYDGYDFQMLFTIIGRNRDKFDGMQECSIIEEIAKEVFSDYCKN